MLSPETWAMIGKETINTLYMAGFSTLFGYVLGLPWGIVLAVTGAEGIRPNRVIYRVLDIITNIMRSIPFLILLILIIPLTRLIVGKSYGSTATIVPLVVSAAPFIARMVESSLKEVDHGVIDPPGGGEDLPDRRRDDLLRDDPRLFGHGRNCRRWRTRRCCHSVWILPLSV